ncbi:MAG: phosphopyruvate hydratase [Longimicrobiales bacterium]|nr:phosphopyruvate hydratase [Longimicrobiales bacterium]
MPLIEDVKGREILDSRGNPTVEVEVTVETGQKGRASVPSGASTGQYEAVEKRDKDPDRYDGKGVLEVVKSVNGEIRDAINGLEIVNQAELDGIMIDLDGTSNKARLGANGILGVSIALARAAAASMNLPLYRYLSETNPTGLPVPMMNILNGGMHSSNNVDIQEFMVMPVGFDSFSEGLRSGVEIFHELRKILSELGLNTSVGDEGGFAPDLASNEEAIELVIRAIERAGFEPGKDVVIALDIAATEWLEEEEYVFRWSSGNRLNSLDMVDHWSQWIEKYPIRSLEDPLDENDWLGWKNLTAAVASDVQLVGDDIFVTNVEKLARGVSETVANSILIKANQIGTLTETLNTIRLARESGYRSVISHRSGETEDTFIADLAVATGVRQIKTGSASRTDRVAKYNQLLRIEESLGSSAVYPGRDLWP